MPSWPVAFSMIGPSGSTGATGPGVPSGGSTGQVLSKNTSLDYHTSWVTISSGSGETGATGSTGLGFTGETGATGSTGLGFTGETGATGSTGLGFTGATGATGSTGLGFTGETGATGSTGLGFTGATGTAGIGTALTENFMVAAGDDSNRLAYTYNGTLWHPSTSGNSVFTVICYTVAWNGSLWVAGGEGTNTLAYSSDGINWTGLESSIFTTCNSVAWNGSSWLASGTGTGTVLEPQPKLAISLDGINWTSSTINAPYSSLASNGSLWVGASADLTYSSDGITWNSSGSGTSVFSVAAKSVAWNGSLWIAGGEGTPNTLAKSEDGITWTGLANNIFSVSCDSVAWNGSLWVAGGQGTNRLAYSIDGSTWVISESGNSIFTTACYTVAWNGSVWVAGGYGTADTLAYSVNGNNWTGLGLTLFDLRTIQIAPRRPLPYVGYTYAKQAMVAYTPGNTGYWASPLPTTLASAIDRLAQAIYSINSTPIPTI